jgi:hypothetical protein
VKQTGRKTAENRSKRGRIEKQNKMDCLCCLLRFAGDVVSHRWREREEEMKPGQIHPFPGVPCGGA